MNFSFLCSKTVSDIADIVKQACVSDVVAYIS